MIALLVLALVAPLAAAAMSGVPRGGLARASGWLVVAACAVAFVAIAAAGPGVHGAVRWLVVGGVELTLGLETTPLSFVVALVVAGVAALVIAYATAYMREERRYATYFVWMGIFVGGMLGLVLASSLVLFVLFWEAVGVASFVLIGFDYAEPRARRAARNALLVTRCADAGLLLAWILAAVHVHTTEIGALTAAAQSGALPATTAATLAALLLIAALGKSAQLPFSIWLPDAMVASTPVSALLHAATMVVAGVFLVLRLFPLFEAAPALRALLAITGGATALTAALVATAQANFKRVLAWSTVSQIGEMMFGTGLGASFGATEHLAAHAAFKATLFLAAGVLERLAATRDLAGLQGVARPRRWTAAALVIGALALAGVPPLAGFWGEDEILAHAAATNPALGVLVVVLVALGGTYVSRAVATTLRPPPREGEEPLPRAMVIPMAALAMAALVGGLARTPLDLLFEATAMPAPIGWRVALVAAGVAGLAWGSTSAVLRGSVPALGSWPGVIERLVEMPAFALARTALASARIVARIEQALDGAARSLVAGARSAARVVDGTEGVLDAAARDLAVGARDLAALVRKGEDRGISDGVDAIAGLLARGSSVLRHAETGKIYVYTMSLFVWVALATAFILVMRR